MPRFDASAFAPQPPGDVQQATEIGRADRIGAARSDRCRLRLDHPRRDLRIFDAERSAEAAARLAVGQLGQLNAVDVGEIPARFSLYTELTQRGAGIVISDAGAIAGGNRQAVELQDMR